MSLSFMKLLYTWHFTDILPLIFKVIMQCKYNYLHFKKHTHFFQITANLKVNHLRQDPKIVTSVDINGE